VRTGTIPVNDARRMSIKVGKNLIDKGAANGEKITLGEIKDVFKQSVPRKFRPIITDDEKEFLKFCERAKMTEEEIKELRTNADAIALKNVSGKRYFIYIPEPELNKSYIQLGSNVGHEFFHTLPIEETEISKKELKQIQKRFKKEANLENQMPLSLKVQVLLTDAFMINNFKGQTPEFSKLYSHLQTKKRSYAYIRTVLRTAFDPRLKQGEQKVVSDFCLPIEKSINPDSIAVRPTFRNINFLQRQLKHESGAHSVSAALDRYGHKIPSDMTPISEIASKVFGRTCEILEGEKEILAKNS